MHATFHLVAVWVCKKTSQSSLQMSLSLSQLPLSTCVTVFAVSHRATQFFDHVYGLYLYFILFFLKFLHLYIKVCFL